MLHAFIRSCITCLLVAALAVLPGCATAGENSALQRFEFEKPEMGVPFKIVLYARNAEAAERAAERAFKRVEELNAVMSDYETDSEVSILSRTSEEGAPDTHVSDDLWKVLGAAQTLAKESGGAFDITVGPTVALWRKARRQEELPDPGRLARALAKVGYTNLVLNPVTQSARLLRSGMRLDLGAIAKGYAADEALKTLRSLGIDRALVAASGDLSLGDPPPEEKGWRIEIVGYDRPDGPPSAITRLANCGIATSGDLFQRVEISGVRYSHIVNPFTGVGMTNHALATVVARNCMTADSLATTCTILSASEALKVAKHYEAGVRIVRIENGSPVVVLNDRFPAR